MTDDVADQRNAVRHVRNAVRHAAGIATVATGGDSTQALFAATLRPFFQRERRGGAREAEREKDQGFAETAPGRRGEQPSPTGSCGGLRQDGGDRLPAARRGGGPERLG